jgi:hypothetical protein|nr:MAG TPA: Protein of unknown function (DUF3800) [Caudoviricetes sp.]
MNNQEIFVYVDDSGVLHENGGNRYFVYSGYIFIGNSQLDAALASYRSAHDKIAKKLGSREELKAYILNGGQKRFLNKRMDNYESFSVVIDIDKVFSRILNSKKSIRRYKDYCLKIGLKRKLQELIRDNKIFQDLDTTLYINIDQQHTKSNGLYDLSDSIHEEFVNGIKNFDYGSAPINPIFYGKLVVRIKMKDSRKDLLIQASDILANSIFTKYNYNRELKIQNKHHTITEQP